MKVILLKDVKGSGTKGQVVEVADGYAKNCLLPKNMAKEASTQSLNELKMQQESYEHKMELEKQEAQNIYNLINEKSIEVFLKSGKEEKMFGAVTAKDICEQINKTYEINLNKKKVILSQEIKSFGSYVCQIRLYSDILANVHIEVRAEN